MVFAVHIASTLNEMLRYHIKQISLITQHSLCNMQLIMWTITFELSMVTTLHGMGMIAVITPAIECTKSIPRVKATFKDIAKVGRVPIRFHKEGFGMNAVKYEHLCNMKAQDTTADLDILWKSSILFGSARPAWSGMMQFVHDGDHPGKASVMFLPMIDMNPTDVSCIYSTLLFVSEHAHHHSVKPIITFDQPLWWKANNYCHRTRLEKHSPQSRWISH